MSIENAQDFYSRMKTDEAFLDQVENAVDPKERMAIIVAAGYSFSAEEFDEVLRQNVKAENLELSDAELAEVSGGVISARALYAAGLPGNNFWRRTKTKT